MRHPSPLTDQRVQRLRDETPGCRKVAHLNNAGAALMPEPVIATMERYLRLEAEIGGYEAADAEASAIQASYAAVAGLLNTNERNVALVENATAAYAQALSAIPWAAGDTIITTPCDYISNQVMFLSLQKRFAVRIVRAPENPEGGVDIAAMEDRIRDLRPRLVAVTHIPTNSGLIQDVEAVGRVCKDTGTLYLVDACQSAGQLPLDVGRMHCDFLTASCRKFLRGPRGTGFLYVSDRVLEEGFEPLFIDLRGAEWTGPDSYRPNPTARRFENFEFSFAGVLGAGEAIRYALDLGVDNIGDRAFELASFCRQQLAQLPGVRVLDQGAHLCAIVTLSVEGKDPADLVAELRRRGINSSKSPRNFAVLDFERKGVDGALRISPHYYNTRDEIDAAVQALEESIRRSG